MVLYRLEVGSIQKLYETSPSVLSENAILIPHMSEDYCWATLVKVAVHFLEMIHEPFSLEEGTLAEDDSSLPCP